MLDMLIKRLTGQQDVAQAGPPADRIAIAAILVEAAHADDVYLDAEQAMIDRILMDRYKIAADEAAKLRTQGEIAQTEATDLVRFTRVLKDAIPFEDRVSVIEAVWHVIYADDARCADEANLVRRLCGLLYVPDRDAGLARQRVMDQT